MSTFIYISGNGYISDFGSLNDKKAATAFLKKLKSGKANPKTIGAPDILKSVGGIHPGDEDEEFRILNASEEVVFQLDNTYDLPFQCFFHKFVKIDAKKHSFFWRNMVSAHGDFFLFEDEEGILDDMEDIDEVVDCLKEHLRIEVTHVFWGDKEIDFFVSGAYFDGESFKDVRRELNPENYDDEEDFESAKDGFFDLRFRTVEQDADDSALLVYETEPAKREKGFLMNERQVFADTEGVYNIRNPQEV